jgi:hypothetical protein
MPQQAAALWGSASRGSLQIVFPIIYCSVGWFENGFIGKDEIWIDGIL